MRVIYHAPSLVKKAKIGGSQIFQKYSFLIFLASPRFFGREKTGVVACGAQNFLANAIGTGNTPRLNFRVLSLGFRV
jgi:hypothetical protein